jgi:large subunit ribosomal protein L24
MKIKKGDMVIVDTGEDSGDTPRKVLQVIEKGQRLIVQGVNTALKHVRRGHPKSPQGGRLQLEMPIQSSNVSYYCDSCKRGSRIGLRYTADGSKERFCRRCQKSISTISPPKARYVRS